MNGQVNHTLTKGRSNEESVLSADPGGGWRAWGTKCRRLFSCCGVYFGTNGGEIGALWRAIKLIANQALVHARSVNVTYQGAIRALAEISFDVFAGQFVSIVGPSGCGKSTLLRLIAGLVLPSSGQLSVGGDSPSVARRRARLSFVFQDPTLLPWRNVHDNVRLPLELEHAPRKARNALAAGALELVGLSAFARRWPSELSGGMRMRASLARALVTEPELLLLDEPFGALDDMTRQTLNEELVNTWVRRRWTGIFVTHNIAEAVFLSERILVLSPRPGRIVADLRVELPAPRRRELRSQPDFARLTGEVANCLRRASA
jgi:NitT/TauT family transport system ATP-binding protein